MASVTPEENKNTTPKKLDNDKVECKSMRSLQFTINYLENEIETVLNQQSIPGYDNVKSKLIQVYKAALSTNIAHEGQPVNLADSELDTTSEYEAFDSSKEHYINHVLMDQLEQQMVATARLRKTGTAQIHSKLKKLIRPELKHLCTVEVQPSSAADNAMETDANTNQTSQLQEITEKHLQGTAQLAHNMDQMCADMLHKAKDLAKAVHIYHRSESSEFQRLMFETPPSTPEVSDNNRLQIPRKNISKKLPI